MAAVLAARDLRKVFRMGGADVRALDGVTLEVGAGEFVGLLGTSGSGKSTLLNLIAGLDQPTGGALLVFGDDLATMSRQALSRHRQRNVGIIFQSFNLISTMSAQDNVALAMLFAGVPRAERDRRAADLLGAVGLGDRRRHRPKELSGGEQQRVAIARALANDPRILLADEPTGNLDSRTAAGIMQLLAGLHQEGRTVLMVTHDAALAARHTGRVITLSDGRVVNDGGDGGGEGAA